MEYEYLWETQQPGSAGELTEPMTRARSVTWSGHKVRKNPTTRSLPNGSLTIDEAQAGSRQCVSVQVVLSGLSVPLLLNTPPAQHGSTEHQVITVA